MYVYKSVCRELISLKYCILQPWIWYTFHLVFGFLSIMFTVFWIYFRWTNLKKPNSEAANRQRLAMAKSWGQQRPPGCALVPLPAAIEVSELCLASPNPDHLPVYTLHTWKLDQIWGFSKYVQLSTTHHTPVPLLEKIDKPIPVTC